MHQFWQQYSYSRSFQNATEKKLFQIQLQYDNEKANKQTYETHMSMKLDHESNARQQLEAEVYHRLNGFVFELKMATCRYKDTVLLLLDCCVLNATAAEAVY